MTFRRAGAMGDREHGRAAQASFCAGFVAVALLALVLAPAALADNPTVKISSADQARAEAALLRLTDFGAGWQGGRTPTSKLRAPSCPGFNPKESDLVVTGHANANFVYSGGRVTFGQDVQVLRSEADVRTDFARSIRPKLAGCIAYQLKQSGAIAQVRVDKIPFPRIGAVSAAYRATLSVKNGARTIKLYSDSVFVGVGRYEYALRVLAPA